jgi:hypothetical protein
MNEQRAFTVVVTSCRVCPHRTYSSHDYWCLIGSGVVSQCIELYKQNRNAITPSCPMWNEAKPIGELK